MAEENAALLLEGHRSAGSAGSARPAFMDGHCTTSKSAGSADASGDLAAFMDGALPVLAAKQRELGKAFWGERHSSPIYQLSS